MKISIYIVVHMKYYSKYTQYTLSTFICVWDVQTQTFIINDEGKWDIISCKKTHSSEIGISKILYSKYITYIIYIQNHFLKFSTFVVHVIIPPQYIFSILSLQKKKDRINFLISELCACPVPHMNDESACFTL